MPTIKRPTRKDLIKKAILAELPDKDIAKLYSTTLDNIKIIKIELKNEGKLK